MLIDLPLFMFLIAPLMSPVYHLPMLIVALLIDFLWSIIAMMLGATKGRDGVGAALGFLFGAMGALLTLAMRGDCRECAHCCLLMRRRATLCPFCGEPQPERPLERRDLVS